MKKFLSNFADSLISRDQMKSVKGGCGGSTCTIRCYDSSDVLLGSIDGGGDCHGGDSCCREKYSDFDNATCTCN